MKISTVLPALLSTLFLFACPGPAPTDEAGTDAGGKVAAQNWLSKTEGGCRVALNLDDGAFILARVCTVDAGVRNGMASQGVYSKQGESLTLQHSMSSCTAVFKPGTKLVVTHQTPSLILPFDPGPVTLTYEADAGSSSGTTSTTLGCFEADGGFTQHPWQ
jgi:hypothetical protein